MVAYIDFENKAPTDECLDLDNKKIFAVLYVIIFAFHPDLDIDPVIIKCSFCHSRKKLISLNSLKHKQLDFKNNKTPLPLTDCTLTVADKNIKIAISEILAQS